MGDGGDIEGGEEGGIYPDPSPPPPQADNANATINNPQRLRSVVGWISTDSFLILIPTFTLSSSRHRATRPSQNTGAPVLTVYPAWSKRMQLRERRPSSAAPAMRSTRTRVGSSVWFLTSGSFQTDSPKSSEVTAAPTPRSHSSMDHHRSGKSVHQISRPLSLGDRLQEQ
jgi:hypothetical protein